MSLLCRLCVVARRAVERTRLRPGARPCESGAKVRHAHPRDLDRLFSHARAYSAARAAAAYWSSTARLGDHHRIEPKFCISISKIVLFLIVLLSSIPLPTGGGGYPPMPLVRDTHWRDRCPTRRQWRLVPYHWRALPSPCPRQPRACDPYTPRRP